MHKTREALDEQQKQMQSSMTAEELLFELDQIRIKYKERKFDIEKGSPRIDESIDLINQFEADIEKNAYPNTFAKDGETEFCGKCGTAI